MNTQLFIISILISMHLNAMLNIGIDDKEFHDAIAYEDSSENFVLQTAELHNEIEKYLKEKPFPSNDFISEIINENAIEIGNTTGRGEFSSDNQWFTTKSVDTAILVNLNNQTTQSIKHKSKMWCTTFSSDNQWHVAGSRHTATLTNLNNAHKQTIKHKNKINYIEFSPDGQWIGTGCSKKIKLIHLSDNHQKTISHDQPYPIGTFSSNGQWFAIGPEHIWFKRSPTITLVNLNKKSRQAITYENRITDFEFSPDSQWIAIGFEKNVQLTNLENNLSENIAHDRADYDIAFSPDSQWIVIHSYYENTQLIYRAQNTHNTRVIKDIGGLITYFEFSSNSQWLTVAYCSCSSPDEVTLYQLTKPNATTFQTYCLPALIGRFSPDGTFFILESNQKVELIDLKTHNKKVFQTLDQYPQWAFSQNNQWFIIKKGDAIELVDITTGNTKIHKISIPKEPGTFPIKLNTDNQWLAIQCANNTTKIFNFQDFFKNPELPHTIEQIWLLKQLERVKKVNNFRKKKGTWSDSNKCILKATPDQSDSFRQLPDTMQKALRNYIVLKETQKIASDDNDTIALLSEQFEQTL